MVVRIWQPSNLTGSVAGSHWELPTEFSDHLENGLQCLVIFTFFVNDKGREPSQEVILLEISRCLVRRQRAS